MKYLLRKCRLSELRRLVAAIPLRNLLVPLMGQESTFDRRTEVTRPREDLTS